MFDKFKLIIKLYLNTGHEELQFFYPFDNERYVVLFPQFQ